MQPYPVIDSSVNAAETSKTFILKVYSWMTLGLGLTAIVSFGLVVVFGERGLLRLISENMLIFWGLLIFELAVVWGLSAAINKIPALLGLLAFFFYAGLNGLTMSIIFLVYTQSSIASTFLTCAIMFGGTSILGYITKIDLSKFGGILMMALIGLIVAMVINIFIGSSTLGWIISFIGVLLFVALTAYDTQKIKKWSESVDNASEEGKKASIMGALMLYLDFINLFLFLLRLMGNRR
jgi:uncharacterized protein